MVTDKLLILIYEHKYRFLLPSCLTYRFTVVIVIDLGITFMLVFRV